MSAINVIKHRPLTIYVNEYSFTPPAVSINHADFLLIKQAYFTGNDLGAGKINAIKKLRSLYEMSLSDAKYLVELMIETEGWLNDQHQIADSASGASLGDILAYALKKQADVNSR